MADPKKPKTSKIAKPAKPRATIPASTRKRPATARKSASAPATRVPAAKRVRAATRAEVPPGSGAAPAAAVLAARETALIVASAGLDKKAIGVEILDVTGKVDYADYLVIMTGRANRQVDAIAQGILEEVERKKRRRALSVEGLPAAVWVLIDFGDVVVHVFQEEARTVYDIDGLWLDAKRLPVPGSAADR